MTTDSENAGTKVVHQYGNVCRRVDKAVSEADQGRKDVTLVAVSKTFSSDVIRPVLKAGHRVFGENRVQEAEGKWPLLSEEFSDVELHLIGPLQTNKTANAVQLFDTIETLDRPKLARSIAAELKKNPKPIELFVQVNTGAESQKAGILKEDLGEFLDYCRQELGLPITGLMCIPPVSEDPSKHFSLLASLARANALANLSMGMSADFAEAIRCGATHVRIGTAIFGNR